MRLFTCRGLFPLAHAQCPLPMPPGHYCPLAQVSWSLAFCPLPSVPLSPILVPRSLALGVLVTFSMTSGISPLTLISARVLLITDPWAHVPLSLIQGPLYLAPRPATHYRSCIPLGPASPLLPWALWLCLLLSASCPLPLLPYLWLMNSLPLASVSWSSLFLALWPPGFLAPLPLAS